MEKITRFADIELRANNENEEQRVEGVAVVFDQETDMGWWYEKIDIHAFDECDMSDVYLLFNHDSNFPLARTLNGSLELRADETGLHQSSNIVSTSQGNDIFKLVRDGLIDKMSFAFTIDRDFGDEWTTDSDGKEHRTIKKISRLYDVSLVTYPAYSQTSAFARSENELDELARLHFEERKQMETEVREAEVEEVVEAAHEVEETTETTEARETTEVVEERAEEMNTNFEVEKSVVAEDISSWRKSVMSGMEERAGVKSTDTGVPVPTQFISYVETAWEKIDILDEVTKSRVSGLLKVPYEASADGANWHAEGATAPSEEALTLGVTSLIPRMIKKWVSVTDELEAMTDDEFMRYIADEVVYRVLKKVKDEILMGVGQGSANNEGIVGIATSSLTETVNMALDFNIGNEALALVDGGESPLMYMNRKTFFHNIMGLKDLQGRPIHNIVMDNTGKPQYFVNGIRVKFSDVIKAYDSASANDVYAIVGDFKKFRLNLPMGENVSTLYDPYTLATEDKSRMIGKILVAGAVTAPNAFAKLTKKTA